MRRDGFQEKYGGPFGAVFVITFTLSVFVFPFVTLSYDSGSSSEGFGSTYLALLTLGLLFVVGPLLLKGCLIAPVTFACSIYVFDKFVPNLIAFLVAAAISAFLTCYLGMLINIDLYPPSISWDPFRSGLGFGIATTASVIASIVALPVWVINFANRKEIENYG